MQEEELQFVAEGVTAKSASPESTEKRRITEGAMELLFSIKLHLNGELLKTLIEERLITQEQYAKAEPELPCDSVFGSAGA